MVDIMVCTIISEEDVEEVPRQHEAAMIIHCFDGCKGKEENGGPC